MKTPKAGQFCNIRGIIYRAKKRTNGCNGCVLNSIDLCPNIIDSRNGIRPLECSLNDIIITNVRN